MDLLQIEQIIKQASEEYDSGKLAPACRIDIDHKIDDYFVNKAIEDGEDVGYKLCSPSHSTQNNGGRKGSGLNFHMTTQR